MIKGLHFHWVDGGSSFGRVSILRKEKTELTKEDAESIKQQRLERERKCKEHKYKWAEEETDRILFEKPGWIFIPYEYCIHCGRRKK